MEGDGGQGEQHCTWLSTSQSCPPRSDLASSPFISFFSASFFPSGLFRLFPGFSLYMRSARASSFLGPVAFALLCLYQRYDVRRPIVASAR